MSCQVNIFRSENKVGTIFSTATESPSKISSEKFVREVLVYFTYSRMVGLTFQAVPAWTEKVILEGSNKTQVNPCGNPRRHFYCEGNLPFHTFLARCL